MDMARNKINKIKFLNIFLSRAVVFYAVLICLSFGFVDYKKIAFNMKIDAINAVLPESYKYLIDVSEGKVSVNYQKFKQYVIFYQTVVNFFPERADAHALLGYCFFKLNNLAKAEYHYKEAIKLNSDNFMFYYNFAMLKLNSGDIKGAKDYLSKAVNCDLGNSIKFLHDSKIIYRSIISENPYIINNYIALLTQRYNNALRLLKDIDPIDIKQDLSRPESINISLFLI